MLKLWAYIIAGAWLAIGFFYFFIRPKRKVAAAWRGELVTESSRIGDAGEAQILVALANTATSPVLLKYAQVFAQSRSTGLALTTVVQVPYQTPIDEASRFTKDAEQLLTDSADAVTTKVDTQGFLRYAHNTAQGVIQSVRARKAGLLILGWRGSTALRSFRMGSTLDPVVEKAACDVVVIKSGENEPERHIRRILCPTKGKGPHGKLVWELVKQLAAEFNAEATIMHVTPEGKSGTIPERLKEAVSVEYEGFRYQVKIKRSADPVAEIQKESEEHDLVVIGSSESSVFQRILFGSKPRQIAEKCRCTVMMVRKNRGIRSWFKRWFV